RFRPVVEVLDEPVELLAEVGPAVKVACLHDDGSRRWWWRGLLSGLLVAVNQNRCCLLYRTGGGRQPQVGTKTPADPRLRHHRAASDSRRRRHCTHHAAATSSGSRWPAGSGRHVSHGVTSSSHTSAWTGFMTIPRSSEVPELGERAPVLNRHHRVRAALTLLVQDDVDLPRTRVLVRIDLLPELRHIVQQ